ncbi:hypothetical protein B0H16DRAFT_1548887 [Mycena metata]|uniref:Uncharacterized protein n=1 Tax=Mycena metata TaxID=1033252 RepID=A0AAD7IX24_9AGAR|nr:hypothetical protein B0H16DRAFT_1548887 [Mycena metata]
MHSDVPALASCTTAEAKSTKLKTLLLFYRAIRSFLVSRLGTKLISSLRNEQICKYGDRHHRWDSGSAQRGDGLVHARVFHWNTSFVRAEVRRLSFWTLQARIVNSDPALLRARSLPFLVRSCIGTRKASPQASPSTIPSTAHISRARGRAGVSGRWPWSLRSALDRGVGQIILYIALQ